MIVNVTRDSLVENALVKRSDVGCALINGEML